VTSDRIRTVFFGTPTYAVPALQALAREARYEVALVVTQPDRPAGRGRGLQSPPVKTAAEALAIATYQPESLRSADARAPLAAIDADVFVVAAYGLIFGTRTLALPRHGCLNLHASLLPAYRGASPVTAAILSGDQTTGVSLMVMEPGLDTGPVVDRAEVPISPTDTTESLTPKLAAAAAELVVASTGPFLRGHLTPIPQDASGATKVRPLVKADGWLNWRDPAARLERRVRAMWPWPRAWTTFRGESLQVHAATVLPGHAATPPGVVELTPAALTVGTGEGVLRLDVVQPAGGKPLPGHVWARGKRIEPGERLGQESAPEPPPPLVTEA
jgi:methionyl-tRNA formyltransferase